MLTAEMFSQNAKCSILRLNMAVHTCLSLFQDPRLQMPLLILPHVVMLENVSKSVINGRVNFPLGLNPLVCIDGGVFNSQIALKRKGIY